MVNPMTRLSVLKVRNMISWLLYAALLVPSPSQLYLAVFLSRGTGVIDPLPPAPLLPYLLSALVEQPSFLTVRQT